MIWSTTPAISSCIGILKGLIVLSSLLTSTISSSNSSAASLIFLATRRSFHHLCANTSACSFLA